MPAFRVGDRVEVFAHGRWDLGIIQLVRLGGQSYDVEMLSGTLKGQKRTRVSRSTLRFEKNQSLKSTELDLRPSLVLQPLIYMLRAKVGLSILWFWVLNILLLVMLWPIVLYGSFFSSGTVSDSSNTSSAFYNLLYVSYSSAAFVGYISLYNIGMTMAILSQFSRMRVKRRVYVRVAQLYFYFFPNVFVLTSMSVSGILCATSFMNIVGSVGEKFLNDRVVRCSHFTDEIFSQRGIRYSFSIVPSTSFLCKFHT